MNKFNAGNPRNYSFATVPQAHCPRTRMWRPSSHKTTIGCDYLYPLFLDEVLPGDTFKLDVSTFARMTNAVVPFMDSLYLDWQFFFVPSRLVWEHWQNFCGEKDDPEDDIEYTMPYLHLDDNETLSSLSIYDYMGLPTKVHINDHDVQSLPFRCYNLVWNEWYRDEKLQSKVAVPKGDGPDTTDTFTLLKRGKRKDYFTSALPAPQEGPSVTIPVLSDMVLPVHGNGMVLGLEHGTGASYRAGLVMSGSDNPRTLALNKSVFGQPYGTDTTSPLNPPTNGSFGVTTDKTKSGLVADLDASMTEAVSIDALRQAFQLQTFAERLMRGGSRYIEILRSMFGVVSPDARLQRPEVLGSFTVPVQLYQNVQTSESQEGGTPQGNLAANGTAAGVRFAFEKSFVEHGYILGLCSARTDLSYQQGLPRMWSRSTKYDYYWPDFAHLGEQAVLNKEIFYGGNSDDNSAFGYQERWSEYKYGLNRISGELRSNYAQSLDVWHLSQNFSTRPTLSPEFIESDTPIARVVAVSPDISAPFVVDTSFNLVCVRPMPLYDVPGLGTRF